MRLNKYLASCGLGARRKVEELVKSGRIQINGLTADNLASSIDPERDVVKIDGKTVSLIERKHYLILNKPKGYITTKSDEKGRLTVMDLIPEKYRREGVFPVGRLDKDTEGLLLITNDGELANRLSHPKFKVEKEYTALIDMPLKSDDKAKISKGIFLHQIKARTGPSSVKELNRQKTFILIKIAEGKKRQIRYTFQKFGYKVLSLKRTSYGPLKLEGVNRSGHRALRKKEVSELLKFSGLKD